jgi:hypothetical protein
MISIAVFLFFLFDSQSAQPLPRSLAAWLCRLPKEKQWRIHRSYDGSGRSFFRYGRGDTPSPAICHRVEANFSYLASSLFRSSMIRIISIGA